jgi:hypothetical protein
MSGTALAVVICLAAIAGGLVVYIFNAARPTAYDQPADVFAGGVRIQQVSGYGAVTRVRLLLALASLMACLLFLASYIANR